MLLGLLYAGQLRPSRGDVVVFNNTSAEHPATYHFAAVCKELTERRFKIPFFWVEFQTFEDARRGQWARLPGYRLVKPVPWSSTEAHGYRAEGEVFEDLVSWKQTLPTRFARHCTEFLKLHTTAQFLEDWLGRSSSQGKKAGTRRLGHWYGKPLLNPADYGERGDIVRYHMEQPVSRSTQVFQDFTGATLTRLRNSTLADRSYDGRAALKGEEAVQFVSLVGLRADEPRRVTRVLERNDALADTDRLADGEHVYAPLFDAGYGSADVLGFWGNQSCDLAIPHEMNMSNCVYCFMKGERALRSMARGEYSSGSISGPAGIDWWADIERRYARVVRSRSDSRTVTRFGFFGANRMGYDEIVRVPAGAAEVEDHDALPCDCTD